MLKAPFSGEVAEVHGTPGATLSAGESLARIVRTDTLWFEIAVSPEGARQLETAGLGGLVLEDGERPSLRIEEGLRWVATAPELSPRTGTIDVLLEARLHVRVERGVGLEEDGEAPAPCLHQVAHDTQVVEVDIRGAVEDLGGHGPRVRLLHQQPADHAREVRQPALVERRPARLAGADVTFRGLVGDLSIYLLLRNFVAGTH